MHQATSVSLAGGAHWPTTATVAAYYCILLLSTVYYCILLHTAEYYCILLNTAEYCYILLHTILYYCILMHITASILHGYTKVTLGHSRPHYTGAH